MVCDKISGDATMSDCLPETSTNNSLFESVCDDDAKEVERLLRNGSDVNASDDHGRTLALFAAAHRSLRVMRVLLKFRADVCISDQDDRTPLHFAARDGSVRCISMLLNAGSAIDAVESERKTALHWAAYNDNAKAVKRLVDGGASVNSTTAWIMSPLHAAACNNCCKAAAALLDANADINDNAGIDPTICRETALMMAAKIGHQSMVALLIAKGASLDVLNWSQETALSIAVANGHDEIIQMLLNAHANTDAALHVAVRCDSQTKVDMMLVNNANINDSHKRYPHNTVLHVVKSKEMANLLLQAGAKIDQRNVQSFTPVHYLADCGAKIDLLAFFVDQGANINTRNSKKQTFLSTALSHREESFVRLLFSANVEICSDDLDYCRNHEYRTRLFPMMKKELEQRSRALLVEIALGLEQFDLPVLLVTEIFSQSNPNLWDEFVPSFHTQWEIGKAIKHWD